MIRLHFISDIVFLPYTQHLYINTILKYNTLFLKILIEKRRVNIRQENSTCNSFCASVLMHINDSSIKKKKKTKNKVGVANINQRCIVLSLRAVLTIGINTTPADCKTLSHSENHRVTESDARVRTRVQPSSLFSLLSHFITPPSRTLAILFPLIVSSRERCGRSNKSPCFPRY